LLAELLASGRHIPAPARRRVSTARWPEADRRSRCALGVETVALTGGCFQNARLLELSVRHLRDPGTAY